MIHDVNNSLPPVVERGMDHKGMSHAGRGGGGVAEKDKDQILSLFTSSRLFASAESSRSADRRVLLGLG